DHVAARGGRRQPAGEGEPRLGRVELGERGVQHDRELAGPRVDALLEPRARELELGEHAIGDVGVTLVVARHERLGGGVDPDHVHPTLAAWMRMLCRAFCLQSNWRTSRRATVRCGPRSWPPTTRPSRPRSTRSWRPPAWS